MATTARKGSLRTALGFLIDQRPVTFSAPVSPASALDRLAKAAASRSLTIWGQPGLMGRVSTEYVYLTRQSTLTSSGFRTLFFGRVDSTDPGDDESCELAGHFALPWSAAAVFVIGLTVCVGWTLRTLVSVLWHGGSVEALRYSAGALVAVVGLFWLARWLGRRDEKWLRERIQSALSSPGPDAGPDTGGDARGRIRE